MYLIDRTGALCFAVDADNKKSVLKTISAMDLDKINMDLVESLLEWIVDGKHDYPPGKNHPCILQETPGATQFSWKVSVWTLICWCTFFCFLYPGAVLVFLPGLAEIKMLYEQLKSNRMFNNRGANRSV